MKRVWKIALVGLAAVAAVGFWRLHVERESERLRRPKVSWLPGPVPGKPIEELWEEWEAVPSVEIQKYRTLGLALPTSPEPIETWIVEPSSDVEELLKRGKRLRFGLWKTKVVASHGSDGREDFFWIYQLATITEGERVRFDARVCPLHRETMERCEVPIHYGLPAKEFLDATEGFPGGPGFVSGGCVVMPGEKTQRDYRCTQCVAAYERWYAEFVAKRRKD